MRDSGRCFPVNFAKLLRTLILKNICERLLLPFKKWSLNFDRFQTKQLRKLEMLRAATFKNSLHQIYKSTQLLFMWQFFLIIFLRQTLTDYFLGLHKIKISRFFWTYNFTKTILQDNYFLRNFQNFWKSYFQKSSFITEAYLEPNRKLLMELFGENS